MQGNTIIKKNKERYSRQEIIISIKGQEKLQKAKITIIGLGALGSVAAELLARSGIGHLTLIDRDIVELSNLQRQLLYNEGDIGTPKAEAAVRRLKSINEDIHYYSFTTDINHKNGETLLKGSDLILDCTDNLHTRFLINDIARKHRIPWIYSAAIQEQGSVMLITKDTPCFACTFKEAQGLDTCDTSGVTSAITVAIASIQVNLAIHYLSGNKKKGNTEVNNPEKNEKQSNGQHLIRIDYSSLSLSKIKTKKDPNCPACNGTYDYLDGKKEPRSISYQCSDTYQFFLDTIDLNALERKWKKLGKVKKGRDYLFFNDISAFSSGRVLVKAKDGGRAKAAISRYIGA